MSANPASRYHDKDRVRVVSTDSHFFGQEGTIVDDPLDYLVSGPIYYWVKLDLGILPLLLFAEGQLAYTE